MRETETYRDNLAAIEREFPEKRALCKANVAAYLGIAPRTAAKWWKDHGISDPYITRETFARLLSR